MNQQVFIVGCSNESMNTAIVMASLDKNVTLLCNAGEVQSKLEHYKFERQMVSLWNLYAKEGKIQVEQGIIASSDQLFADKSHQEAVVWLFLDALSHAERTEIPTHITSSQQFVIISGITPIGQADKIAKSLATPQVFYLPLVFMKDGESFSSMLKPDMVLLGEKTLDSHQQSQILNFFLKNTKKQFISDIKTAEFARSSIMGMLATRLSFMNEMARLADSEGVNIKTVEQILGLDKRIGKDYLKAGWGFGGKSLPSELDFLIEKFDQNHVETSLLESVKTINEDQKELIFRKFWQYFDGFIEGKTVLIWGAGYRNGTGRTTHSAIHPLLNLLWSYNINTIVYANNTAEELLELYGDNPLFSLTPTAYDELANAQALFILNWSHPTLPEIHQINAVGLPVFDGKNVLKDEQIKQLKGFYTGIGC